MRNFFVILFILCSELVAKSQCKLPHCRGEEVIVPVVKELHKDKIFLTNNKKSSPDFVDFDLYQTQTGSDKLPKSIIEKLNSFIVEHCGDIYYNKVKIKNYVFLADDRILQLQKLNNKAKYILNCELEIQPAVFLLFPVEVDLLERFISMPPFKKIESETDIDICLSYAQVIQYIPIVKNIDIENIDISYDNSLNQNTITYTFSDYRNRKTTIEIPWSTHSSSTSTYWIYQVSYNFQTKNVKLIKMEEGMIMSCY